MKETLRVITAGSVDDGKSTLIGRLLYDAKVLTRDQLETLGGEGGLGSAPDFAALTDGLMAEKEQGITIDVAYRFFATQHRRYILADCPGHEEFTRNMVTGASTADVAIVLIDPTKLDFAKTGPDLLLIQTKRHTAVLAMLGVRHIVVAINKMDAIAYDQKKFQQIATAYQQYFDLVRDSGFVKVAASLSTIPISALKGDNIVHGSQFLSWYGGDPLLAHLDGLELSEHIGVGAWSSMPVQYVVRQEGGVGRQFRGYQGRVEHGPLAVGQAVKIFPSGVATSIAAIYNSAGEAVQSVAAGLLATVQLATEVDAARGNYITYESSNLPPQKGNNKNFSAVVCWFDKNPFSAGTKYILKHTSREVQAKLDDIAVLNLNDIHGGATESPLTMNHMARVAVKTSSEIDMSLYGINRSLGSFILIDPVSYHTVAAGVVV